MLNSFKNLLKAIDQDIDSDELRGYIEDAYNDDKITSKESRLLNMLLDDFDSGNTLGCDSAEEYLKKLQSMKGKF